MGIPFHCPEGHVFILDERTIRFVALVGTKLLHFLDDAGELLLVTGEGGHKVMPDIVWALKAFRGGRLVDVDAAPAMRDGRRGRLLHLDRAACIARDSKVGWRFDWADAALDARIVRSKRGAKAWLENATGSGEKPKWRSLLRWMARLEEGGRRIGALVNAAGRERGQTQLSDVEDRLVHKWAIAYWRPKLEGFLSYKEDAAAMMIAEWDELVALGVIVAGPDDEAPSAETMRERINSLECHSTHATRYGRAAADAKYNPSGEPIPVTRCFERTYIDGSEYEHSVHFADDDRVPAAKMKGVMAMDCYSSFVFPFRAFCGPYRPEQGLAALRNVMTPPAMSDEDIADDPEAAMFYSIPSDVMIDRDRTLIPPRAVPGVVTVVQTVELAEAYHHDAKAELENFHKYVKGRLRELVGGRILSARSKYDPGYNPLKTTNVTRAQYLDLVEQCRLEWNATAKASLGFRSPNDVMRDFVRRGETSIADPGEIRRALSSTPGKKMVLTPNGLRYDSVHYRWMREDIASTLSMNIHKTPFAGRLEHEAKVLVSIRVWDDDIDYIEVFDEENGRYVGMYSVEPEYTGGLSRWEHHQYKKALRAGANGAITGRQRLRGRATYLKARRETLRSRPFRERDVDVALLEGEERRLSGVRAVNPGCAQVPELHKPASVGADDRPPSSPPPQRDPDRASDDEDGGFDERSDPTKAIADELGTDLGDGTAADDRWKTDCDIDPYDSEEEE